MTGKELAKQLRATKGKVCAFIPTRDDGFYAPVEKAALIEWLEGCGDTETGMYLKQFESEWFFDRDHSI